MFRAGVIEVFAKDFEQGFVGCKRHIGLFTVQREADLSRLLRYGRDGHHCWTPAFADFLLLRSVRWFAERPIVAAVELSRRRLADLAGATGKSACATGGRAEGPLLHRPRIRELGKSFPTQSADRAPCGLNQSTVEFKAPRIARVARAGSVAANSAERIPAAII